MASPAKPKHAEDDTFRSRLERAAEESKSAVRPTVGVWTAIKQVINGHPPTGALPNEENTKTVEQDTVKKD
jgi:hypothetical protein